MSMLYDTGVSALQAEVEGRTGICLDACLQCGCCSGGCTGIEYMEFGPRQIIQMVKLNDRAALFESDALWYCASCHICEDRCPAGIQITALMDALRAIAMRRMERENAQSVFHQMFLSHIEKFGRLEEGMFAFLYNRRTRQPMPGKKLLWRMLVRGRIRPSLPHRPDAGFKKLIKYIKQGEARRDGQ